MKKEKKTEFFLYNSQTHQWIELFDGFTLGRARGNDGFAADWQKSENHCRFDISGGGVTITDLGSPNGTAINEGIIPANVSTRLKMGDRIRINDQILILTRNRVVPDEPGPGSARPSGSPDEKEEGVRNYSCSAAVGKGYLLLEIFPPDSMGDLCPPPAMPLADFYRRECNPRN